MTVRAKLVLSSITETSYGAPSKSTTLKFTTQYDASIPEDQRFAKATPNGTFEMVVDNPVALEQLKLGEAYYLDLSPAAKP